MKGILSIIFKHRSGRKNRILGVKRNFVTSLIKKKRKKPYERDIVFFKANEDVLLMLVK